MGGPEHRCRSHAGEQIACQEPPPAERRFDHEADDEQHHHVADDVSPAPRHELAGDEGQGGVVRGHRNHSAPATRSCHRRSNSRRALRHSA